MTISRFLLLSVVLATSGFLGCGSGAMPKASIEEKQTQMDDAENRFKSRDFEGAKQAASNALTGGGLNADQVNEAKLILIESCIRTKDQERAATELTSAEATAADLSKVYVLQAYLAQAKGDEAGMQQAMAKAYETDPNASLPE